MSAKAKKPSDRVTPVQRGSTPVQGSTPINVRATSPTRSTRLQEKQDLQCLNDRLAIYIDRVRHLENENSRLSVEIQTSQETVRREVSNIKAIYDNELSDARKLLDDTAREKAKMEIEAKRIFEENDDLRTKLDRKTKDLILAENSLRVHESRFNDINGKYSAALTDRKKAIDELKELENENDRLRKLLDETRKQLEAETLARVDLENNIQSLREELTFKDQVHSQELNETRTRRQIEVSEIDGRLTEKYEALLQESLQELRDQYENQIRNNRGEIESLYQNKIKNLQNAADRQTSAAASLSEQLRMSNSSMEGLQLRIRELEATDKTLSARIHELEKLLNAERERYSNDIASLEAELARLRDQMAHQLQEYSDLMDIKVSLDMEIAAYDKLLKGEEYRLNITPTSMGGSNNTTRETVHTGRATPSRRTPSRAAASSAQPKRKRAILEESEDRRVNDYSVSAMAKGDVEITEVDPEGRYIKLRNTSNKEVAIGGWQLIRAVDGNETTFKFHRSLKLEPEGVVTVWSSNCVGVTHEPPHTIVMKQQKWLTGDSIKTQLLNGDGEEVAVSERVRRTISSHASRHREHGTPYGNEELYHQQVRYSQNAATYNTGDEQQNEDKCRIM